MQRIQVTYGKEALREIAKQGTVTYSREALREIAEKVKEVLISTQIAVRQLSRNGVIPAESRKEVR